ASGGRQTRCRGAARPKVVQERVQGAVEAHLALLRGRRHRECEDPKRQKNRTTLHNVSSKACAWHAKSRIRLTTNRRESTRKKARRIAGASTAQVGVLCFGM